VAAQLVKPDRRDQNRTGGHLLIIGQPRHQFQTVLHPDLPLPRVRANRKAISTPVSAAILWSRLPSNAATRSPFYSAIDNNISCAAKTTLTNSSTLKTDLFQTETTTAGPTLDGDITGQGTQSA